MRNNMKFCTSTSSNLLGINFKSKVSKSKQNIQAYFDNGNFCIFAFMEDIFKITSFLTLL